MLSGRMRRGIVYQTLKDQNATLPSGRHCDPIRRAAITTKHKLTLTGERLLRDGKPDKRYRQSTHLQPHDSAMKTPRKIGSIVAATPGLQDLIAHTGYLQQLNQRLKQLLEEPIATHISVAAIREDTLIIHATSPAWAAKLRYRVPEILAGLTAMPDFPAIKSIRVRVSDQGQ